MCEWKPDFDALNERVTKIEGRMSQVEHDVGKMRSETQEGFKQGAEAMREINVSVSNLAHDFGERMNSFDKRLVTEKEKWGDTLRSILVWTAKVVLAGAALAMGITAWRTFTQ
ncbi:MAG: hypothetical protein II649_04515 [Kiritimatiellae bacterium]|nr:hypothetical protein [Kiritimatiellia bacterium]